MLPIGSQFPNSFDNDTNLFLAKDSLKVRLGQDYNPGDKGVLADTSIDNFPATGIITLIDHCDPSQITSLFYGSRKGNAFMNIELTPGSNDTFKSKLSSVITQQLDALHHNNIASAIIAMETFLGTAKDENKESLFGRLNFLKKIAYAPKAWFEADIVTGLSPLTVVFTSTSTGVDGPVGPVLYTWNFGDGTKTTSRDNSVFKTYMESGIYSVSLEVINLYGTDTVVLKDLIKARSPAPEAANVNILPQPGQNLLQNGLRTTVNQFVLMEVPIGENPKTPNISFAGELLNDNKKPIDPVVSYTWQTSSDSVKSSNQIKSMYDTGGLYDVSLRVDTKLGAFRISQFPKFIDVIEPTNIWLWLFNSPKSICSHEFGLSSETFKVKQYNILHLGTQDSFLDGTTNEKMQKEEFRRNNLFVQKSNSPSGFQGEGVLLWASGRKAGESPNIEKVMASSFNAFLDLYSFPYEICQRPWNWAGFATNAKAYLIGGIASEQKSGLSLTNDSKSVIDFSTMEISDVKLYNHNYVNGSHELRLNVESNFSKYRTTWRDNTGYMLRSSGESLKTFYKTEGTIGEPFINITKLLDLPEPKTDGQLLGLNDFVYFLSNDGNVFGYNENTNNWQIGQGHATLFNDSGNFLATSDKDQRIYISYNNNVFVKYNTFDATFTTLGNRPTGEQWLMDVF